MASTFHAACCALAALVYWAALGYPVVRRLLSPALAWPFAPVAGWALHSVVALPLFFLVPFDAPTIAFVALLALAASWSMASPGSGSVAQVDLEPRVLASAWIASLLLAMACAAAILPKHVGDAVMLSDQIFDHAKVSMVDEMARLGLPAGNPYFAHDGSSGRLSYYYLLHFSAAELARLLDVTGWEADVAMTFFAAFTSLAAMMGLAVKQSGRASASLWVVALAASSSSRVLFDGVFGRAAIGAWLPPPGGLGGWMFQSSWVPQHLVSTTCVLLAVLLMQRLSERRTPLAIATLAAVAAAAFESSAWVGGVVFALVAVGVASLLSIRIERSRRRGFAIALVLVASLTVVLASPLLIEQLAAARLRNTGFPIAVRAFDVLGNAVPEKWRDALDAPAFWLLLLPVEMTAVYLTGLVVAFRSLRQRAARGTDALAMRSLAVVVLTSLVASWLLRSTLADNNDLGWRAALLASATLIVFAAMGLVSWIADRRFLPAALAVVALALGLPEGVQTIHRNLAGHDRPEGRAFAAAPALWNEVRAHAGPAERVASNPAAFQAMTPWPVNIAWALLSDRRSCYAGWELTQVFTAVPHATLKAIDAQFARVFAGRPEADDVKALATRYDCGVIVVTPQDGAWSRDPFERSPFYRRIESDGEGVRLYRRE